MKIIDNKPNIFLQNLVKAYTEGIYSDTPLNRKLGRVGMSYKQYKEKFQEEDKETNKEKNNQSKKAKVQKILNDTKLLKKLKGKNLDAIINFTHSDAFKEMNIKGIKVNKNATDEEKRFAIAEYYAEQAENSGENLDDIIEDIFDEI